jgi:hypothetical protein
MKTLKIIAVLTLAAMAATLLIASAYAYTGGRIGTSVAANSPTGASYGSYAGRMMGSAGMMRGYGYSAPDGSGTQQSGTPSTATPSTPSNQYPIGRSGCRSMMSRLG